jgi:hypothetical protein
MSIPITELIKSPIFLGGYITLVIMFIIFAMSFKWIIFGLKYSTKKSKQYGLLLVKNRSNNMPLPYLVNLTKDAYKLRLNGETKIFPFTKDEFLEARLFGMPFTIRDFDDAGRSYGIYGKPLDEKGEQETYTLDIDGQPIKTDIPKLSTMKSAYRVDPDVINGVIAKHKLIDSLMDFIKANKFILIGLFIIGIIALASFFVAYQNNSDMQDKVIPTMNTINSKVDTISISVGTMIVPMPNSTTTGGTKNGQRTNDYITG